MHGVDNADRAEIAVGHVLDVVSNEGRKRWDRVGRCSGETRVCLVRKQVLSIGRIAVCIPVVW